MPDGVEDEVCEPEYCRVEMAAAPEEGSRPRDKLIESKGLGEVIVCAGVEAEDFVFNGGPDRKEQDRGMDSPFTEPLEHFDAVEPGKVDIEDDEVVLDIRRHGKPVLPVMGQVDGVALFLEALLQEEGYFLLIFHDEDGHGK